MTACDTGFPIETVVENLRVLGIRSTPADLHPGETAVLQSLILDPSLVGQKPTVLWVGCEPDPYNLNRSACSDPSVLSDPAALGASDGGLPPGVKIIGFNDRAAYSASPEVFSVLPADDPRRITGTVGQVLAIAVAEEISPAASEAELRALFDRVQAKTVNSLIALFRIRISEDPQRNTNPVFGPLTFAGEALAANATLALRPGQRGVIDIAVADEVFESYTAVTPAGTEQKTERVLAAWYSSSGRYPVGEYNALREDVKTEFVAPGGTEATDPMPPRRSGTLYVTLRDTRGGQSWQTYPFFICDDSLGDPTIASVTWGQPVLVEGQNLERVLDVLVDGVALKGSYNPSTRRWEASPLPLPSGTYPVTVTTRSCSRLDSLSVTVP